MSHISLHQIVQVHQALADPLRILIVHLLLERELRVGELVAILKEPQHKISRHLAVLRRAGVLRDRREGTQVRYTIAPDLGDEWKEALRGLRRCWDKSPEVRAMLWRMRHIVGRHPSGLTNV